MGQAPERLWRPDDGERWARRRPELAGANPAGEDHQDVRQVQEPIEGILGCPCLGAEGQLEQGALAMARPAAISPC